MTPSGFMQREKVRGVTDGPPDLSSPTSLEEPTKHPQAAANYGTGTQKCRTCQHFDGTNGCSVVDGEIDPEGHSRFYEPSDTQEQTEYGKDDDIGMETDL